MNKQNLALKGPERMSSVFFPRARDERGKMTRCTCPACGDGTEIGAGRRVSWLLDVLTPLSVWRQESVEKMERRISGVSYVLDGFLQRDFCVVGFYVPE